MTITTTSNNTYSYLPRTNEILAGRLVEPDFRWEYSPFDRFHTMAEVNMFIIGLTEQCNLRCKYCCYSGAYKANRKHGHKSLEINDIDKIISFIKDCQPKRPLRIAFYGGEPMIKHDLMAHIITEVIAVWGEDVLFSVTTNGTLLHRNRIDWLVKNNVEISISIDGPKEYHDRYRVDSKGQGSFEKTIDAISYIKSTYPDYLPKLSLQMTLDSFREIPSIAEGWNEHPILRDIPPQNIHGVASNFDKAVKVEDFNDLSAFYLDLLDLYEKRPDYVVLKTFFEQIEQDWINRPIIDVEGPVPMPTCMPINTKLFIDTNLEIGVCEKMADSFRIGTITTGIDWQKANDLVSGYYNRRCERCASCPTVRFCRMCLTAMEHSEKDWDILCHNERVYTKVAFLVFCEMAERGLIQ